MNIEYKQNSMHINGIDHFNLDEILDCGQSFRWYRDGEGFSGTALGKSVYAEQHGRDVIITGAAEGEGWEEYFDLYRDYGAIKQHYAQKDEYLRQGMAFAGGIRILKQPEFETLISFIISANNNVKRIKGIVDKMCRRYGQKIGEDAYDFPMAAALSNADEAGLKECGAGYRAAYIIRRQG